MRVESGDHTGLLSRSVQVRRGVNIGDRAGRRGIDGDEAVVATIAHKSEACPVGRPTQTLCRATRLQQLLRLAFWIIEVEQPNLTFERVSQLLAVRGHGRRLTLAQQARLVGFLAGLTPPLRRSYTSPRHDCPSGEDYYVETFAGSFPDCCLRNYRLARSADSGFHRQNSGESVRLKFVARNAESPSPQARRAQASNRGKPFSKHYSELHGVNSDGLCSQFGSRLLKQLSKSNSRTDS